MTQPSADALFAAITETFGRSQQALAAVLSPPPDTTARVAAQRAYREAATELLELERRHNETGLAPMQWDLELVAQPLVQQTMIEADLVDALGRPDEADALRDGALAIAQAHLGPGPFGRLMRERGTLLALDGRFNEALTQLADVRREFAERGDVLQAAQTALDEAAVLEWLGDQERALTAIQEAAGLAAPRLAGRTPGTRDIADALERETVVDPQRRWRDRRLRRGGGALADLGRARRARGARAQGAGRARRGRAAVHAGARRLRGARRDRRASSTSWWRSTPPAAASRTRRRG